MMMAQRRTLVLQATEKALDIRRTAKIKIIDPINIYDLATDLGIEVRFADISSMEGMYLKDDRPAILVSALRPSGRQVFTCAHELGHHVFNHGTRADELIDRIGMAGGFQPEEFLADCFAGLLLMPKMAVAHAFNQREWNIATCTPLQVYKLATWFGVGYTTLINHMVYTLNLLPQAHAAKLLKVTPKQIRSEALGTVLNEDLVIVDSHWTSRAIDIQVGDVISAPPGTTHDQENVSVQKNDPAQVIFVGQNPGVGRLLNPMTGWSAYIRVTRRGYVGRNLYRHLEDIDD